MKKNKKSNFNMTAGDFPKRLEIELSGACNLQCSYCPRRYLKGLNGFMDFDLFKKIIGELSQWPETILVLHRRGESLLNSHFIKMCRYIKGRFKEVQLATNATLLDEDKSRAIIEAVSFISFSIDLPLVFERTRKPASYKNVESNILRFLRLNQGKASTQVSMVKTAQTSSEDIEEFKLLWKEKVDRVRVYEEHSGDGRFGSLAKSKRQRVACVMPFYEMLIYFDGTIGRCNHDWDSPPLGDVNNSTISQVWNNALYKRLRKQQVSLQITDKVCKNCDCWYPQIGSQGTGETVENTQ